MLLMVNELRDIPLIVILSESPLNIFKVLLPLDISAMLIGWNFIHIVIWVFKGVIQVFLLFLLFLLFLFFCWTFLRIWSLRVHRSDGVVLSDPCPLTGITPRVRSGSPSSGSSLGKIFLAVATSLLGKFLLLFFLSCLHKFFLSHICFFAFD